MLIIIGIAILLLIVPLPLIIYACYTLRRARLAIVPLILTNVTFVLVLAFSITLDFASDPVDPKQNLLHPTLSHLFPYALIFLQLWTLFLAIIDLIRPHTPLSLLRRIAVTLTFIVLLGLPCVMAFYASLSRNGSTLATAIAPDVHIKAVQGLNIEGDSAYLLYRRPGEFFYHPFDHLGSDLVTITAIHITFPSPHQLDVQTFLTHNIPGSPTSTSAARYDLTTFPPRRIP